MDLPNCGVYVHGRHQKFSQAQKKHNDKKGLQHGNKVEKKRLPHDQGEKRRKKAPT